MNIQLIIAMHKPYEVPQDALYLPLHVGAQGKESFACSRPVTRDDTGVHISRKNASYCELTGLYWAWKNLEADAIGLVHYRRYFTCKSRRYRNQHPKMDCVLTMEEAQRLMQSYDIVVPTKRRYYIESLYSHYAHTLDGRHLDLARQIIHTTCPEYEDACAKVYASTWGYMFNMCMMKREYLDSYCSWLFPILEQMEATLADEAARLSAFEARLYGRVSEILFNVWLTYVRGQERTGGQKDALGESAACAVASRRVAEVATMHMEPVNWWKKGTAFLKAKFFGKKYEASF